MRKYTDEQFTEAVKESFSIRETLNRLDVIPSGGNYFTFHNHLKRLELDISHFDGGATHKKSKPNSVKLPLNEILILNSPAPNAAIKKRLFAEGIKKRICEYCSLSEWMGEPIPLELEHVNGNNRDNRLENLKIICPNCHALTPTYRGRNAKIRREQLESDPNFVPKVSPAKLRKIEESKQNLLKGRYIPPSKDPGRQILLEDLESTNWSFTQTGRKFQVSDTTVRKWCRKHDLPSNRVEVDDFKNLVKFS